MSDGRWIAAAATLAAIVLYELWHTLAQRRRPHALARSAHAGLREEWFASLSAQAGSEILAVQTLRNSRGRWAEAGGAYVRKAGLLYSWSLRSLLLIVPLVAFLLHPYAGPVAAVLVTGVLHGFDRTRAAPLEP